MLFGLDLDPKLLILFVVCVIFLSLIAVEGFAQYMSYTDMLRAKYGLSASTNTASMTPAEIARRKAWSADYQDNATNIYDKVRTGQMTANDLKALITPVGAKTARTSSYLRDITRYTIRPEDSPDWNASASKYDYKYETVLTTDKLEYINRPAFESDLRLTQGRFLQQCAPDDFNCMRMMSYAKGADTYGPATTPAVSPNDTVYDLYGNSSPATMPTNDAGFPTTAPPPPGGTDGSQTPLTKCFLDCVNQYGGMFTPKVVTSCMSLCESKLSGASTTTR